MKPGGIQERVKETGVKPLLIVGAKESGEHIEATVSGALPFLGT